MGTKIVDMKDLTPEMLDELVHEEASNQASNVNNAGVGEQVLFLLINGWSEEDILNRVSR